MAREVARHTAAISVEFPAYIDYTLNDLRRAVDGSQKVFAKWADLHLPPPNLHPSRIFKTVHGYDDSWTVTHNLEDRSDGRGYAIGAVFDVLGDILGTCNSSQDFRRVFWRCLPDQARPPNGWDVETIFANVKHLDKELGKTATALKECEPNVMGTEPIRRLRRAEAVAKVELLSLLRQALRGRLKLETAFWKAVQGMAKFYCEPLCTVSEKNQSRTPLSTWDLVVLDEMLRFGTVELRAQRDDRGSETWRLSAEPDLYAMYESRACLCAMYGKALCIPLAYQVAQSLADPAKWPRFRRQCLAPSCGREFYTGREKAVACPGERYEPRDCKRECDDYRDWLQYHDHNLDDWSNPDLQKTYIEGRRERLRKRRR